MSVKPNTWRFVYSLKLIYLRRAVVFLLGFLLLIGACSDGSDSFPVDESGSVVLVRGSPMVGGANGINFDHEDKLFIANVFGQSISIIDPDTGEIIDRLGREEGILSGADDLTFDAFGTLFWTDPTSGTVKGLKPEEDSFLVAEGFPSANPITVGDDGRLFFAQCFASAPNGIFEADPAGVLAPTVVREGDKDCASNGMDWKAGALYSPRWFEGRVVRVNIDSGELTDITTDWGAPAAVKFNSMGELHAVNQGNGEVVRIDIETGERTVLAVFPEGWLDNLAFDSQDRLFVSSASEGAIVEILDNGSTREVSPGGMIVPMGISLVENVLYTAEPTTLRSFDSSTGEQLGVRRSTFGLGPFSLPTNVSEIAGNLVLMSFISNQFLVWDLKADSPIVETSFLLPMDAEPFQGDLLISEIGAGRVVRARMPDLVHREVIAEGLFFPAGIAVYEDDAYVSDAVQGTVFQIIRGGDVLSEPEPVATDLNVPEGISLNIDGSKLLVIEGDISSLTEIDLETGARVTIASDLNFQPRKAIPGLITHWFNDVAVDKNGVMYVNSDGNSIIYKFKSDAQPR